MNFLWTLKEHFAVATSEPLVYNVTLPVVWWLPVDGILISNYGGEEKNIS